MDLNLSPIYQKKFGNWWILWFSDSNNYSVVDADFKSLLDLYTSSGSLNVFKSKLCISNDFAEEEVSNIYNNINLYLRQCNTVEKKISQENTPKFNSNHRRIFNTYSIGTRPIEVVYASEEIKKIIHPQIAHLETDLHTKPSAVFDIYIEDNQLLLYKNEELLQAVLKQNYHFIQGKFFMHLLCIYHQKAETDWIGTFHGSTISDGENSILCIGKSGKGKSTLCALMARKGFKLVADDVSPMLDTDNHIYSNPSAISIKHGAFKVLNEINPDFKNLSTTTFNTTKGAIKYIPPNNTTSDHFPCKAIIMVNYKEASSCILEVASIKSVMETLIPDSWLSPESIHAKKFLEWLSSINFYQLTYSDHESAYENISTLFKSYRKTKK